MKRLSISDVARDLGLSKTTVSWVINGKSDDFKISKETKQRVLQYIKENNYRPNQVAKSLSLGSPKTIGLIVPNIADSFYVQVARTVELEARQRGYAMVYSSSEGDSKREALHIKTMSSGTTDGIILASTEKNSNEISAMMNENFPFVLFDRHYPNLDTHTVLQSDRSSSFDMVCKLIDKGYKRIAFITTESYLLALRNRYEGYADALRQADIPVDEQLVHSIPLNEMEDKMDGVTRAMLLLENKIDAIFFATHYLAMECLKTLQEMQVMIPNDIGIASFGDDKCFTIIQPRVSAIILPCYEIGMQAVDILCSTIENPQKEKKHVVVSLSLILRESF